MFNVHIYPSTFEFETRILKVTRTLVARGLVDRVLVVAKGRKDLPKEAQIDLQRSVTRVDATIPGATFWSKSMRFVEWSVRVFWRLRRDRVDMVNCHSLSVLPLCVAIKLWHRAILIYEPHELETETATFTGIRRTLAKKVERYFIKHAAFVIVVSESISQRYKQDYGLAVAPVVMNVPEAMTWADSVSSRILREEFTIPDGHLLFMYQGALDEERGVRILLEAFQRVSPTKHLVFMGFGPLSDEIRTISGKHANIHLFSAVPPSEVMRYTRGADVGIALLIENCDNHRYALPNKLFHYLHAGLPVIVSDLPEMGSLVDNYECGWRVENTPESIACRVEAINYTSITQNLSGVLRAASELHWDKEAEKLAAIYHGLFEESFKVAQEVNVTKGSAPE